MPIFDVKCSKCGTVSEIFLRTDELGGATCPQCGSTDLVKLLSPFNTVRQGAGPKGVTCCGREERCDKPPCSSGEECPRG
jgi:putative FmdB family regulatory protein